MESVHQRVAGLPAAGAQWTRSAIVWLGLVATAAILLGLGQLVWCAIVPPEPEPWDAHEAMSEMEPKAIAPGDSPEMRRLKQDFNAMLDAFHRLDNAPADQKDAARRAYYEARDRYLASLEHASHTLEDAP